MKALVLVSGGVDSATCLAMAVERRGSENVIALSIVYGQKHEKEVNAARRIAAYYRVEHLYLDLTKIFQYSDCSLLSHSGEEIPKESYEKQLERQKGSPVSTYVPFRNGLFLSGAASIALSRGCQEIYYGSHSDDAAGNAYPDCSGSFNEAMGKAVYIGSGNRLRVIAPFVNRTKAQVVKEGLRLGVPYEFTWSCYEGGDTPCGKCGTCLDRARAFAENHVPDPALAADKAARETRVLVEPLSDGNLLTSDKYRRDEKMEGRNKEEMKGVTLLGNQGTKYPDDYAPQLLETFINKHPDNDYFVKFNCPEFTSLCPVTGQPDFASITISYVPGERMVESKSLKLYLFSFRNHGDFHEDCVNMIMKDLIRLMEPKYIEVWGKFTPRGGISIDPYCNYGRPGTRWEKLAWHRMMNHDLFPEKTDNR